jgi:cephalosporin hydroxylase
VIQSTPITSSKGVDGSVGATFLAHTGRPTTKWTHYPDVYDLYFSRIRQVNPTGHVKLIEIGVAEGGSLDVWRAYFGSTCSVVGIDVNPRIDGEIDAGITVLTGSQADPVVLNQALTQLGGSVDVVIDDGSHLGRDQIASFEHLWPRLNEGGIYIVEDLHTSYWSEFEGGPGRRGTFIEYSKRLIDDMHLWYHRRPQTLLAKEAMHTVASIAIHDSIVVLTKGLRQSPRRISFGSTGS